MLISEGAGRSLINKTSSCGSAERDLRNKTAGSLDENTLISGGAGRKIIKQNFAALRAPLIGVF
jgi:hypothetical protein